MQSRLFTAASATSLLLFITAATIKGLAQNGPFYGPMRQGWILDHRTIVYRCGRPAGRVSQLSGIEGGCRWFFGETEYETVDWADTRIRQTFWRVKLNLHAVLAVTAVLPAAWLGIRLSNLASQLARERQNRCRSCGYNLTGNVSGICPECGTPTGPVPR